jgi:hypothetical protein
MRETSGSDSESCQSLRRRLATSSVSSTGTRSFQCRRDGPVDLCPPTRHLNDDLHTIHIHPVCVLSMSVCLKHHPLLNVLLSPCQGISCLEPQINRAVGVDLGNGGEIYKADDERKRPIVFVVEGQDVAVEERSAVEWRGGGHCAVGWLKLVSMYDVGCVVAVFGFGCMCTWLM